MAKKPGSSPKGEFVFFDVVYEDGSQHSNRRVPRRGEAREDDEGEVRGWPLSIATNQPGNMGTRCGCKH